MMDEPTELERSRLRSLMERTGRGPRFPYRLCGPGVRAWIDALVPIAEAMDALDALYALRRSSTRSPYARHEHRLDVYFVDDREVVYCTTCDQEW